MSGDGGTPLLAPEGGGERPSGRVSMPLVAPMQSAQMATATSSRKNFLKEIELSSTGTWKRSSLSPAGLTGSRRRMGDSMRDAGSSASPLAARATGKLRKVERQTTVTLLAEAKEHQLRTAVTVKSKETGELEYLPWWETRTEDLRFLGVGVELHFTFLKNLGFVLFLMFVLTLPSLYVNSIGDNVKVWAPADIFGRLTWFSVGNLGSCPDGCSSTEERLGRPLCDARDATAWPKSELCKMQVRDVTLWIGVLDILGILFLFAASKYFCFRMIPDAVLQHQLATVTPSRFTVEVARLPPFLAGEEIADESYEELLESHFEEVVKTANADGRRFMLEEGLGSRLDDFAPWDEDDDQVKASASAKEHGDAVSQSLAGEDEDIVHSVVLVRDYERAIDQFNRKGHLLRDKDNLVVLKEKAAEAGNTKEAASLGQQISRIQDEAEELDRGLNQQAQKTEDERGVVQAFVTFNRKEDRIKVLDKYRFSRQKIFRWFQPDELQFQGRKIRVNPAVEPEDILWENLDMGKNTRRARTWVTTFITVIILSVCAGLISVVENFSTAGDGTVRERTVWILADMDTTRPDCLSLCSWTLYDHPGCEEASTGDSTEWNITRVFDANRTDTNITWTTDCSDNWDVAGCEPVSAAGAWIGIEFEERQNVQCMRLIQDSTASKLRLFSCAEVPSDQEELKTWRPEQECQELSSVSPRLTPQVRSGGLGSGRMPVLPNATCDVFGGSIPYEAARLASEAAQEAGEEIASEPVVNCYCSQQLFQNPQSLVTPDSKEQRLCLDFLQSQLIFAARTWSTVAAIQVVNWILYVLYARLIVWERHRSVTQFTESQLSKLFLSQFVNTGVLVLLVNTGVSAGFLVNQGAHFDFTAPWFGTVGLTLLLSFLVVTIFTTIVPLAWESRVAPYYRRKAAGTKATSESMNELFALPEWGLATRSAQMMNVLFCILVYSGGMPILYLVGVMYCFINYWTDRISLLRYSRKPPQYSEQVMVYMCNQLLQTAVFLHVFVTAWTYGNQLLFPGLESEARSYALSALGLNETSYSELVQDYQTGQTPGFTFAFAQVRIVDMTSQGAVCHLAVLLVFLTYYAGVVLYLPVRWLLTPLIFWMSAGAQNNRVARRIARFVQQELKKRNQNQDSFQTFDEAKTDMEAKGLLTSYRLGENEAYSAVYNALLVTNARAGWMQDVQDQNMELIVWNAEKAKKELKKAKAELEKVAKTLDKYREVCPTVDDLRQMLQDRKELDKVKALLARPATYANYAGDVP